MQELIDRLIAQGLTEEQANKAIDVIKGLRKKVPSFAGAIDKLFDKYGPKEDEEDLCLRAVGPVRLRRRQTLAF